MDAGKSDWTGGWRITDQAAEGTSIHARQVEKSGIVMCEVQMRGFASAKWRTITSMCHIFLMFRICYGLIKLFMCLQDGHAVRFLPRSALLATPQHVRAYVSAALQLLSRAHCLLCSAPSQLGASSGAARTDNPISASWPLSEGSFASQLLQQLPEEDLQLLCLLYWRLLTALPDLAPSCGLNAQKEEASLVNALVRCSHLPLMSAQVG